MGGNEKGKYAACILAGILLYLAAEIMDGETASLENGRLKRNPAGQGEAVYELYVKGLEEQETELTVVVPEQELSGEQVKAALPNVMELLCGRILGDNEALSHVTEDLRLEREIPEYGLAVKWESEAPELISSMGMVSTEEIPPEGVSVYLTAELSSGSYREQVEIPVTLFPKEKTAAERLQERIGKAAEQDRTADEIRLPEELDGRQLEYRERRTAENRSLILLGFLAAGCLAVREKSGRERQRRMREKGLVREYPELLSRFIVLTGAGYPVKQAWRMQAEDYRRAAEKAGKRPPPIYEEMQFTLNQMDTGTPEVQAYGEFGRRLGLRCYIRFASLLESCVYTGGRDLRRLLEEEMETAFRQRTELAKREGETASAKFLLPMFLILGVVMIMIIAPAFLTMG